ncbi:MAG: LAGLIDADG endonuclease [candidate division WS2 bacterium ADurb.Bin280]|uniref:LAGLIDADG endonuclease n=1 Tax=candidate division WS2 bacterium ADurb.Bin280 TaxID=1852829 RepID=A0A1V5SDP3_9BACT|nr:MAG: LAGLIDADG endonuclease [candidate division WS2 bacterium ADurb.Bin280]
MKRENPSSADNQQERSKMFLRGYVTGLVDGEGSFHIAFQIRKDLPLGISIIPEFHISQSSHSKGALEIAREILGCGYIKPNHRKSKDDTYVLVVRDRSDLLTKIVPFFQYYRLQTRKSDDFAKFCEIVGLMSKGLHKTTSGVRKIIDIAYTMNGDGARRIRTKQELITSLKSSETIRKSPPKADKI